MTNTPAIAEIISAWAHDLQASDVPDAVRNTLRRDVIDSLGLTVAVRKQDFVIGTVNAADGDGNCTIPGHAGGFDPMTAMLVAGTSIHGEDFDDTFEGQPVHIGAVLVPALLAAAEQRNLSGEDILRGMAVGGEFVCRLALVAPTAMHKQGFHPTAICGAFGAAVGVATALRLSAVETASALGIVGSMASGIIEYLAEGTWTKRMHPGWAASAGWRAVRMAENGFAGPRTVFEGSHGVFHAFAKAGIDRNFSHLTDGWGSHWNVASLAFKPCACGTMAIPFVDCARELREKIPDLTSIVSIKAKVGEGTVHRLWEPLAEKRKPTTPYGAKFSVPYCVAVSFVDGVVGLDQFTYERIKDPAVLSLAEKVSYDIDPENEYPVNYTGELCVTLADGTTLTAYQSNMRGGKRTPLTDADITEKFMLNTKFGGWDTSTSEALFKFADTLFDGADMSALKAFRI